MNLLNGHSHGHPWKWMVTPLSALATLLTISTLVSRPIQATTPEQASINNILGNSSELLIRRSGRRESVQTGSVLQQVRDALITVPPNNARAFLRFLSANGADLNLFVQTNPHPEAAIYYFPCRIQGGDHLIGWGLARNEGQHGCETGLQVMRGASARAQAPSMGLAQQVKQLVQVPVQQLFYCSVAGSDGSLYVATAASGEPCTEAIQQCRDAGGMACGVLTTGFWWTSDEQLRATLDCADGQSFAVDGTGMTLGNQIQTLIQPVQGQTCALQIYRPQDFVITPAPDEAVIALGDDGILVQTRDTPLGLQVDVLKGAINVRSHNNPGLQLINQGERYLHTESGGEVMTFNRSEALTSVDMEVLCAFAAYEANPLNVSACREANLSPAPGQPPITFCDREQASGGQTGDRRTLQMGARSGEIELDYDMLVVPDRVQMIYEGQEILDTGFISGSGTLSVPFDGRSGRVDVIVTGNQDIATTQWGYTLYCPK